MTNIQFGITESRQRDTDELTVIAKVRIPDVNTYNGEYGFDWLDIDSETREIKKVQGVDFSNIEYFFQPDETELGNIETVAGKTDKVTEQIRKNYPDFLRVGTRYTDRPYILAKKGQEITLHIHLECFGELKGGEILKISGCSQCSVEFESGAELTLKAGDTVIPFKIRCNDLISGETMIDISLKDTENNESKIGGFVLLENTPLKLTFRVIVLVSNEGDVNTKAKKLFEQFKNNDILKYLNENSLNQEGYELELDNQSMFDSIDTLTDFDEFLYAFDKTAWTANGNYIENYPIETITEWETDSGGNYTKDSNGYYIPKTKKTEYHNVLAGSSLDTNSIIEYRNKVKNEYNAGLIILADFIAKDNEAIAFSKTNPLDYYSVFIYSSTENDKKTYSHEIGHMLGLPHNFCDAEVLSYIRLFTTEKTMFNINKNNRRSLDIETITCKKEALRDALVRFITENKKDKNLSDVKKRNEKALGEIDSKMVGDYFCFKPSVKIHLLMEDYISLSEDYFKYAKMLISQRKKHLLYFKQSTTKHIMDYYNDGCFFTSYQIKIMREDYVNYHYQK